MTDESYRDPTDEENVRREGGNPAHCNNKCPGRKQKGAGMVGKPEYANCRNEKVATEIAPRFNEKPAREWREREKSGETRLQQHPAGTVCVDWSRRRRRKVAASERAKNQESRCLLP